MNYTTHINSPDWLKILLVIVLLTILFLRGLNAQSLENLLDIKFGSGKCRHLIIETTSHLEFIGCLEQTGTTQDSTGLYLSIVDDSKLISGDIIFFDHLAYITDEARRLNHYENKYKPLYYAAHVGYLYSKTIDYWVLLHQYRGSKRTRLDTLYKDRFGVSPSIRIFRVSDQGYLFKEAEKAHYKECF